MFLLLYKKGAGLFVGKDGGLAWGGEGVYKLADVNGTFPPLY